MFSSIFSLSLSLSLCSLNFPQFRSPLPPPQASRQSARKKFVRKFANCHLLLFLEKKKRFKKSGAYSRSGLIAPRATEPPLYSLLHYVLHRSSDSMNRLSIEQLSLIVDREIDTRTGSSVAAKGSIDLS